ncbi:MAG TPA: glycosyltransferase, partial [Methylophilus sp.]
IILDDGSTDDSLAIIRRFEKIDDRIRVYSWGNKGIIAARNELTALARADIIANMDADDLSMPTRLEKQYAYFQAHADSVVVTSPVLLIDADGAPICKFWDHPNHEAIDRGNLAGGGAFICNPASAIRKSALISLGGFRSEIEWAEDIDFFLRAAEIGKIGVIPEVLFHYRQHLTSVGYAKKKKQFESMWLAVQQARYRRGMPQLTTKMEIADESLQTIYLKWGWWALNAGNLGTAFKYGFKTLHDEPFNFDAVRLLFSAFKASMFNFLPFKNKA